MLGNSLVVIDRFNNFVIDGVIVREAHFSKRALILSNLMALLRLRAQICCKTKEWLTVLNSKETVAGSEFRRIYIIKRLREFFC